MRRTRRLILLLILGIIAVVGVSWRIQKGLQIGQTPPKPASLPDSVTARAEDWCWDEAREGKPVVRVCAKDFRQNTDGGTIELQNVELQVFHDDGATFDRVKSAKADFQTNEGVLFSEGEVEITMGVPAEPKEKPHSRLVKIRTSGARFETKSGKATTDRPAFFEFENGQGQCVGATYDPGARELTMNQDVKLKWQGSRTMEVESGSLVYKEAESKIWLSPWSKFKRDTLSMEGGTALVTLREGQIEAIDAHTAKGVDTRPKQTTQYAAELLGIRYNEQGVLQSVAGDGNAVLISTTPTARTTVNAKRIDLDFEPQNNESTLKKGTANGSAVVQSDPVPRPGAPLPDTRILRSEIIAVYMRPGGEEMEYVDTQGGPGTVEFRPNRAGLKRRVIDGKQLRIEYAAENAIKAFQAVDVTTRSEAPPVKGKPQPPAITRSQGLNADFDPKTSAMSRLEQWGDFRYEEGERRATAERAEMHNPSEDVLLIGKARVWDPTGSTNADHILLRQKAGEVEATGNVSSTRLSDRKTKDGMLSGDDPLQAKAENMMTTNDNLVIVYEGKALLWQGPNRIQADRVRIDRRTGRLDASGKVETQLLEKADARKKTQQVFTIVRAPELNYDDRGKIAHYKGGSVLQRGSMVVTAREIRAFLSEESNLDRAYADGNVKIVDTAPDRTRTGISEHAEYYTQGGKVVLAGGQPQFIDSVDGVTSGRQITFYGNDNRLVVEGEQSRPAESKIPRKGD